MTKIQIPNYFPSHPILQPQKNMSIQKVGLNYTQNSEHFNNIIYVNDQKHTLIKFGAKNVIN